MFTDTDVDIGLLVVSVIGIITLNNIFLFSCFFFHILVYVIEGHNRIFRLYLLEAFFITYANGEKKHKIYYLKGKFYMKEGDKLVNA